VGKQHLHGEQLQMFMPAHKLAEYSSQDAISNAGFGEDEDIKREHGPFADTHSYNSKLDDVYDNEYYADQDYANPKYRNLEEDLSENGINEPITLTHYKKYTSNFKNKKMHPDQTKTLITEGHHRLAYAYDTDMSRELPVDHEIR